MNIGQNTQNYINNNNYITLRSNDNLELDNEEPMYYTRFQKKILSEAIIQIPVGTSDIQLNNLLDHISNNIPGIKSYIQYKSGLNMAISITINGDIFEIKGKMRDIYSFFYNSGLNLLCALWNDHITQENSINQSTIELEQYNKIVKPITPSNLDDKCPICYESFRGKNNVITECHHIFHNECLLKWLTEKCQQPNCPICRKSFHC